MLLDDFLSKGECAEKSLSKVAPSTSVGKSESTTAISVSQFSSFEDDSGLEELLCQHKESQLQIESNNIPKDAVVGGESKPFNGSNSSQNKVFKFRRKDGEGVSLNNEFALNNSSSNSLKQGSSSVSMNRQ